ncbi:efflux RND transporter periplasmic adaptor subunit [Opitutus sp. ER46]|uniref:efflux RND transporter periplasmic adaptor subunit n=1 Tax=Opitutus sp. ER46 TaxID=2161864 RepID=UPI000D324904|nr:efflux RND transporter periplasmic adaptor subunit [Opitutus sp. ER46]PTX98896.1 hypothetical protein DB354_02400 [Opitutus sp. ER46]
MKIPSSFRATLLVVLVPLTGCDRDVSQASPAAVTVSVHIVHASNVPEQIVASGAIEAIDKAEIAFMVSGRVLSVPAADGALIKQGDVLAQLDPVDYERSVAIAEAQLQEVKSRHARLARLHEAGSLTATDFDRISSALQQAEAAATLARRQLDYTVLHAPCDGWVVRRGIAPGLVAVPAVPVFTLLPPGAVWANVGVAETEISRVQVGQLVDVHVPAAGHDPQRGTVESILPNADPLARTFTVKVRLANRGGELRQGHVVVAHILTGRTHRALLVPPQAVQKHPDGSLFVWLVEPTRQTAVRQLIQVESLTATGIEVSAGLTDGDQIVLNVPHTLFEGTRLALAHRP